MSRLLDKYKAEIVPALKSDFGRENIHSIPKIDKIVISMGLGKAVAESQGKARESKRFSEAVEQLSTIAGQRPVTTKSKKAVSNFKLRDGWDVGLKVTLRGQRMYEFLDRLTSLAIPRVRDFRGLNPGGFDGRGNFAMGLSECGVFPEIHPDKITFQQGMNIVICTSARNDAEARKLLTLLGLPFRS